MFSRKIIFSLREWANNSHHKPLIIRGARQVGKTTLIKEFAKEFDDFLHLNLEREEDKNLFEVCYSAEDALTAIYFLKKRTRKQGRVLLFIDEIQNSPKAVAMLRYFYEDLPELYVIAAGSLLETLIDKHISFPVGRVEYLALRPCSFSEFLGAMGEFPIQEALLTAGLPDNIHNHVMKLFNEYVLTGGMPEIVSQYALKKDIVALQRIYETLLTGYKDDIEKYAPNTVMQNVLRHILMYGWQYAGQRIKFERFANSNYKSREVSEAFRILEKALVLELSYPTVSTSLPVQIDMKKSPKLLWLDTGLVNYIAGFQQDLFGVADISEIWKGKIAEHIVAQGLLSSSHLVSAKRNFWVRDARNSQAEVDFVIPHNGHLMPVEVKSGEHVKMKSLHLFMEQSSGNIAVRFRNKPLSIDSIKLPSGKEYTLYNIPFYYAECLETVLKKYNHYSPNIFP
jgi:predicted AAA+ superfamily ATPase